MAEIARATLRPLGGGGGGGVSRPAVAVYLIIGHYIVIRIRFYTVYVLFRVFETFPVRIIIHFGKNSVLLYLFAIKQNVDLVQYATFGA